MSMAVGARTTPADPVEAQYVQYSYPEPHDDIPAWLQTWNYDQYNPSLQSVVFWPEGRPREDLEILVAGCGSMQAAVLAYQNPGCRVTGIDFSETSVAHEGRLRERHALENLTLHRMDVRAAAELDASFDLVVCSGVLHHLADPSEGLRALARVLEPSHGVIATMLYGRAARSGVYMLQDVFRRMRVPQTAEGVRFVRATINRLRPRHPGRDYFERSPEMDSDAAVVDTFLHKQDRAYNVDDVLNFVEENDLHFKGWVDRGLYNQDWDGLDQDLPERDRWSAIETLTLQMPQHVFLISRPERDPRSTISFEAQLWLDYFPQRHRDLQPSQFQPDKAVRGAAQFAVNDFERELVAMSDGTRSIGEILKSHRFSSLPMAERRSSSFDFYKRLWRAGHVELSCVPLKRR